MAERDLAGARVALVGASGGLGSRIGRELVSCGARLLLVGRDAGRLDATGLPGVPVVVPDLLGAGTAVADAAREQLGGLDGVVHAAGVVAFGPLADTAEATLEELFLTNTVGPLALTGALLPLLTETGGFVVLVSAVVAERPLAGMVGYSASKAGLSAVVPALRQELRRTGVSVLDVRPPHTETGLAGRPVAGRAPRLPAGLDPDRVARLVVQAVRDGRDELASADFTDD